MPVPSFAEKHEMPIQSSDETTSKLQCYKIFTKCRQNNELSSKVFELATEYSTALEESVNYDIILRDKLLSLTYDSHLSELAIEHSSMRKLVESYSETFHDFLTNTVMITPFTKDI